MIRNQPISLKLSTLLIFFLFIFPHVSIPSDASKEISESYELLIIAPEAFVEEINPLVLHKIQQGIQTLLITTDEIYDESHFENAGRDDAEKIKYFIKDSIETWDIDHVLLFGGRRPFTQSESYWVPVRYAQLIRYYPGYEEYA
jgi:hypothetical protein